MVFTTLAAVSALVLALPPYVLAVHEDLERRRRLRRAATATPGQANLVPLATAPTSAQTVASRRQPLSRARAQEGHGRGPRDATAVVNHVSGRADGEAHTRSGELHRPIAARSSLTPSASLPLDNPPPYAPRVTFRRALAPTQASGIVQSAEPIVREVVFHHGFHTGFFKSFDLRPIQEPPVLNNAVAGDVYIHTVYESGQLEEYIWYYMLLALHTPRLWVAVELGFRRLDGRRLVLTGALRQLAWVTDAFYQTIREE
ncbi:hypothetical protein C8Q80DRAFT_1273329 [Daedaleopsis nitida]|nr:hypothetical protein C8Q80DRAFT_1273329 [Daedaleopsis nitida]